MKTQLHRLLPALLITVFAVLPLRAAELPYVKPEKAGLSSERLARIDKAVNDCISRERIAGAVSLVMREGKIAYFKAHGMMDKERGIPMKKDAIFRICSIRSSAGNSSSSARWPGESVLSHSW